MENQQERTGEGGWRQPGEQSPWNQDGLRSSVAPELRLCVVDDHPLIREGLRGLFSGHGGLRVVADACDAESACRALEVEQPDLFILDVSLPGIPGTALARELLRVRPSTQIVFFSMHVTEDYVSDAFVAGARGYVGKNQPFEELMGAVLEVSTGKTYMPPKLSRPAVEELIRLKRRRSSDAGPLGVLSAREREVFALMVQGMTNDAASSHLNISRRTVETHRANLLKKLNIHSVAELLRFAARHDLITH
jgi:DNA-binding NarL/FixJ family response regulator